MFILRELGDRQEQVCNIGQIQSMIENAIFNLQDANQWTPNKINIDEQIKESAFVFRRVIQLLTKSDQQTNISL